MNFYNNSLSSRKYLSLIKRKKLITKILFLNQAMLMGTNLSMNFKITRIIKRFENVNGDIIEFGIWNGNNLFAMKKGFRIFRPKRKSLALIISWDSQPSWL